MFQNATGSRSRCLHLPSSSPTALPHPHIKSSSPQRYPTFTSSIFFRILGRTLFPPHASSSAPYHIMSSHFHIPSSLPSRPPPPSSPSPPLLPHPLHLLDLLRLSYLLVLNTFFASSTSSTSAPPSTFFSSLASFTSSTASSLHSCSAKNRVVVAVPQASGIKNAS
jgi:hypothetical protein